MYARHLSEQVGYLKENLNIKHLQEIDKDEKMVYYISINRREEKGAAMAYMIRCNVIDNRIDRGTFGTENVAYFDDRFEATKEYNALIEDVIDEYKDTSDRNSVTLLYLYEYDALYDQIMVVTNLIHSASISWYNTDLFVGLRQN